VVGMYSFFTPDPRRLATFWADLMGLPIASGATEELVMLDFDHQVGPVTWIFERREEAAPQTTAPLALDIGVGGGRHWTKVADRAEALGAERIEQREVEGVRWIELRDPDGNRFRVFGPRPT